MLFVYALLEHHKLFFNSCDLIFQVCYCFLVCIEVEVEISVVCIQLLELFNYILFNVSYLFEHFIICFILFVIIFDHSSIECFDKIDSVLRIQVALIYPFVCH